MNKMAVCICVVVRILHIQVYSSSSSSFSSCWDSFLGGILCLKPTLADGYTDTHVRRIYTMWVEMELDTVVSDGVSPRRRSRRPGPDDPTQTTRPRRAGHRRPGLFLRGARRPGSD